MKQICDNEHSSQRLDSPNLATPSPHLSSQIQQLDESALLKIKTRLEEVFLCFAHNLEPDSSAPVLCLFACCAGYSAKWRGVLICAMTIDVS